LQSLIPLWKELIKGQELFYLEDKGWSLALHARFAADVAAEELLEKARKLAEETLDRKEFRVLPGHKFLEAGPQLADKGEGVKYLLKIDPLFEESLLYLGDDDKDEIAFSVIQSHGGAAIRVCSNVINQPIEDWRLPNPREARLWLRSLPQQLA
jgi:trehalose-phosphatase